MSTPSFLDTLRAEVARMQATHPEREGELARAHALILHGMVVPSPEDPEMGQVLSSDGHTVYHINGVCDCDAGQHGRACKHVYGWRLYQYVQRKLDTQVAQTTQEPTAASQTPVDTPAALDASTPLPEAPASVNVRVQIAGRDCQITLRDTDEAPLLLRLQTLLERYPMPTPPTSSPQARGKGWCPLHNVQMKLNQKEARSWYSHRLPSGKYCTGKGRR
jgi:hypothetical protein